MSDEPVPRSEAPLTPDEPSIPLQIQQSSKGDRNQTISQVHGGMVVYVSGGQAIFTAEPHAPADSPTAIDIGSNPYKGLSSFRETDCANFFGRSRDIEDLWQRFHDLQVKEIRLLPIYGPSGSGKSSLARAGLIPELGKQPLPGREKAWVAVLVPGTNPLQALALVLAQISENDLTPVKKAREFAEELELKSKAGEFDGLHRIASALPEIGTRPLIILVDQFEEVYSLCNQDLERNTTIANLLYAASNKSSYVSVILTMRSDFLGETQQHPSLNRLFSAQGFLVPTMDADCLREAISQPAKLAGHPLDTGTIGLLIEQTVGREGALPMLQFTLSRIWEGMRAGKEPSAILTEIGGVGGALAGEAERIYESLSGADRKIARRVFLGLVQLGEGVKDTRRRANIQEFVSQQSSIEQIEQVIARFSNPGARLITLSASTDEKFQMAEVTHEALFDHWDRLKTWLEVGRLDLPFQRRLEEDVRYWDRNSRPEGNLWRSPDLDSLKSYHQRAGLEMSPLQVEFLKASNRADRSRQRLWKIIGGGLVGGLVFMTYLLQQTQRQRVEQLAITTEALLATKPVEAKVNAIAAFELSRSPFVSFPNYPTPDSSTSKLLQKVRLQTIRLTQEQNRILRYDAFYAVAFSPDGTKIVSGSGNKKLQIWDATTGKPIGKTLQADKSDEVFSVAVSPDGQKIISGGSDTNVRMWDAKTGKQIGQTLTGHTGAVRSVAVSRDGQKIVSGSRDNTLRVWDVNTGRQIGQPMSHPDTVAAVVFSLDGKRVASSSSDRTIRLWDISTGKQIGEPFTGHDNAVLSIALSPDGKSIISGSLDKTIRRWDIITGKQIGQPLNGHEDGVMSVAFSPDGKSIVSSSFDRTVRLWDVNTGKQIGQPLNGHEDNVNAVAFSPDGKKIVSGSKDKTIRLWAVSQPFAGHEFSVHAVAFSPDGQKIASSSRDKTIRLWDASGKQIGQPFQGHDDAVYTLAFSPDGKLIASGSNDKTVRVWNTATGKQIGLPFNGHQKGVLSIAFSPDGQKIISGSNDKTMRLWATTGRQIGLPFQGHENVVTSVAFSPDGQRIASGSWDGTIRRWDVKTGQQLDKSTNIHQERKEITSVAFSPDGQRIVSASLDKTMVVWDANTGKQIGLPLNGHKDLVSTVAFSHDGKQIVSGSNDTTVRLWNAMTGKQIGEPLKGHTDSVLSVAFSPDDRRIVSGSLDQTVGVWNVDWAVSWESLLQTACKQLQNHPIVREPNMDAARDTKRTCEAYWIN
jgi:WD40 repeat protein